MNIVNPYNELEHKVYNRTFLRNIQVKFEFDLCEGILGNTPIVRDFFNKYFNVVVNHDSSSSYSCIELRDSEKQIKFVFTEEQAVVEVGAGFYKSFTETMFPLVVRLTAFMEQICSISCIKKLTITKQNVWQVKADTELKEIYASALRYTFKEHHVDDFVSIPFPNEPQFKMSKEANIDLDGGMLKVIMATDIKNAQEADFMLDFIASADSVSVAEALDISTGLSNVIYCAFHDIVSKNVVDLMEQKGGKQ